MPATPTHRLLRPVVAPRRARAGRPGPPVATLLAVLLTGALAAGCGAAPADDGPAAGPAGPALGTAGLRTTGDGTAQATWLGGDLAPADSCADLAAAYADLGEDLVGPHGWEDPYFFLDSPFFAARGGAPELAASDRVASGPTAGMTRADPSATGTTVQEAGVDEPDTVKTEGSRLVRVTGGTLSTHDVGGAQVVGLGSLDLTATSLVDPELLLVGDTVVVVGRDRAAATTPRIAGTPASTSTAPSTRVLTVDVSDPTDPRVTASTAYDAGLVRAVQHGTVVRLVLSSGLPDLPFTTPRRAGGSTAATLANRGVVRAATAADWLPGATVDDLTADGASTTAPAVTCDDVAVPSQEAGLGTLAVLGLDASTPESAARSLVDPSGSGLLVDTDLAYASAERLYVATAPAWAGWDPTGATGTGLTTVHELDLEGVSTSYVASGEVLGTLADRWAMDEADGVLRLALGPGAGTGPANAVATLRRDGDRLVEAGRVDGLGRFESIESVRWFDDLAIVVTFRRVDPLHTVDLSDPDRPRLLGTLTVPGFSAHLHPLGPRRLLGIGEGPDRGAWGAQVGLFDLGDLADPRPLGVHHFAAGTTLGASVDPRQLTWLPGARTALSVVYGPGRTRPHLAVVSLTDGRVSARTLPLPRGTEARGVRTVLLADRRVVLLTDRSTTLLDAARPTPVPDPAPGSEQPPAR
ncbi:hypothetical protein ASF50_18175 [Nocardioides sp. Leaf307]|nr:hypothetical protein ASF50_18175 [Nocardioides sp. Leaf307]